MSPINGLVWPIEHMPLSSQALFPSVPDAEKTVPIDNMISSSGLKRVLPSVQAMASDWI